MAELKANNPTEKIILDYINANASDVLKQKIRDGKKDLDSCMDYVKGEAKKEAKNGVACIEDHVVFGWVIHYFEEDSIAEPKKAEPKKEEPKKAEPKKPADLKKEEEPSGQMNIFDFLG